MLTPTANWLAANAKFEKQIVYRFVFPNYYRSFANIACPANADFDDVWLMSIDDHTKNINDLQGGADQETMCFTVQDHKQIGQTTGAITKDMATNVFEGQLVQLYVGFASMANLSDYLLLWQGYVDQVDSANNNLEYYFQCSDVTVKLQQPVYLKGDFGGQTSGNDIKTLKGHPLDMLIDILQNQIKDPATGAALPSSLIDIAKIQAYRDGVFSGIEFLFHLQQPPAAADFIKNQLLKPLGGYLWVSQGKITVNFFAPITAVTALATMGPDTFLTIPTAEQTAMVNTVQYSFDKDDGLGSSSGNYLATDTQEFSPSVAKYAVYGEQNISSDGMRSALQGYLISWWVSQLIFLRYGFKNLKFDQNAPEGLFTSLLYEPGDVIAITHPLIPDRSAGVLGITGKLFEVTNKKVAFYPGLVTLSMIDASYLNTYGLSQIAPNGEADYTSASSGDKARYMFLAGSNAKYSNGDPGNKLG